MKEKLLIHVDEVWQKDAVIADLEAKGLHPRAARFPREYASIISGIGGESYKIYVPDAEFTLARQTIAHLLVKDVTDIPPVAGRNEFKRVIVFSIFSLVLVPVVFNWLATQSFFEMRRDSQVSSHRVWVAAGILTLGWAVALALVYLIFREGLHLL